jgi:hypothetical protein
MVSRPDLLYPCKSGNKNPGLPLEMTSKKLWSCTLKIPWNSNINLFLGLYVIIYHFYIILVNYVCDKDWVLYQTECYYFGPVGNQSLKNWYDANDFCKSSGAYLVVIGDPYEMSFVTGMYSSAQDSLLLGIYQWKLYIVFGHTDIKA